MTKPGDWWKSYFDDYRPYFEKTGHKEFRREVRFVVRQLGLKKGTRFLDCPCGFGRVSFPLARMGVRVTGVDITQSYLDEFAKRAGRAGVRVRLIKEDMRRIDFREEFDAAANLRTSFGYFDSEAQNMLVLRKVYRALRPGGRFLLSTLNRDWILLYFVSSSWSDNSGFRLLEARKFDYARSVMHGDWHFIKDGVEKVHKTTLRLYSLHELRAMFQRVGFVDIEGYGSLDEQPSERTNRYIYMVARKP